LVFGLPASEEKLLKTRVLLFFFLWTLLGIDGFREAMASHAFIGSVKEAGELLEGVNQGANLITDAAKFIDANGVVKIILTAENASNCFFLSLGLEGTR
jgi:hypothetical protein